MDSSRSQELEAIRSLQRDLRTKLESLDHRIRQLESEEAAPEIEVPVVEKTTEPTPEAQAIPAAPLSQVIESKDIPPPLPLPNATTEKDGPMSTPTAPEPVPANRESLELHFGQVWLVRIGIVILLTGLVFLGNFAWKEIVAKVGPAGKLAVLYAAGLALGGIGFLVKRKRSELATYGKVLIGGGIATIYYTTYAAHFVEPLRVIGSPLVGGVLLLTLAVAIVWLADCLRSQAVAAITIVLGFYTAAINPIAQFSLFSNLVLSVMAIALLVRRRWVSVSLVSMVGSYLAYAFWRLQSTGTLWIDPIADQPVFWTALLFPACYWLVFTIAVFLGRTRAAKAQPFFLTVNNTAFFGLAAPLVAGNYPDQLWIFALSYGGILLFLSFLTAKLEAKESPLTGCYLAQGLTLVLVGLLFKFSGYQLALILALQSATLMKLSRERHSWIFQVFSSLSAVIAATYALGVLVDDGPHASITSASVAVVLTGVAWLFKRQRGLLAPVSFQWRAAPFTTLALVLAAAAIFHSSDGLTTFHQLIGLAILATVLIYPVRMPELLFGGQVIALLAIGVWFGHSDYVSRIPCAAALLMLLALMHWWINQRILPTGKVARRIWEGLYAAAAVAVLMTWVLHTYKEPKLVLVLATTSLMVLLYAFATRSWLLALGSQTFSIMTIVQLLAAFADRPSWPTTILSLALFSLQAAVARHWKNRASRAARKTVTHFAMANHAIAILLLIVAVDSYVPVHWKFLIMVIASFVLFSIGATKRILEPLIYAALLATVAGGKFVLTYLGEPTFPPDFAGLFLILLAQQIGRRRCPEIFGSVVQTLLIVGGIVGTWVLMGKMVTTVQSGFLLTISWSVLAFAVLVFGFLLKERAYRLLGLGILIVSIARLFIVDVSQLDTMYRSISFVVLGLLILALGFLYNRFAHVVRKWI